MRPFIPLIAAAAVMATWSMATLPGASAESSNTAATTKSDRDCEVVERESSGAKSQSGSLSSSITAGGGKVTGHTTGAGQSVTVHSGNGRTSSSVAIAGSSGGSSSVVTGSGSGDCVIYVDPGEKKEDSR